MGTTSYGPVGIGGWLVLPALGLVLTPLMMAFQFYQDLLPALTPQVWHVLTDAQSAAYSPLWGPLIVYEVLVFLTLFIFTLWLSWRFFTKSKHTPKLFVIWLGALAASQILDHLLSAQIPALADKPLDPAGIRDLVRSIINAAIWIPYFLMSERVKNTFVEPVS
jgi:hypothetical protein